jgi:hypothetical protein
MPLFKESQVILPTNQRLEVLPKETRFDGVCCSAIATVCVANIVKD